MDARAAIFAIGVIACLTIWWAKVREVRALERALRARDAELLQGQWWAWWLKNAAETTPLDSGREHLLRFAIAAQLAPSQDTWRRDLHSIASDATRTDAERLAAKSFLDELTMTRLPWVAWREDTGKPPHSEHALEEAYRRLLASWSAFLFHRPRSENEPGQLQ